MYRDRYIDSQIVIVYVLVVLWRGCNSNAYLAAIPEIRPAVLSNPTAAFICIHSVLTQAQVEACTEIYDNAR